MIFQKSNPVINVSYEEFKNGLWTSLPPAGIPIGASVISQNVDYSRGNGRIVKRRGIQTVASNGAGKVVGLYQYILSNGNKFDVVSTTSATFSVSGGVFTSRYSALGGAGTMTDTNFTVFSDLLIQVSKTESTQKWDGAAGSFSVLLGTPPANGKFICVWQNRVWIFNTSAGKSRAHYSNIGLPEDWVTPGAAGFIDVNINDGDEITGAYPVGSALYVFKNRSVHKITGISATTFNVVPIILNRGCVAPRSIVSMGPYLLYMSQYGIHAVGDYVDGFMSEAVRYDIQNLPGKSVVCAGKVQDLYVLSFDQNGDGLNESSFVLDTRTGSWTQYLNTHASVFIQKDDGNLYSGGSDAVKIRQHDSGEDDDGTPITMTWRSGRINFDDFTSLKQLYDVWWDALPLAGKHLTTNTYVDGLLVPTASDTNRAIDAYNNQAIKCFGLDSVQEAYGRFVQIEFVNAELNAPVEIYEFSMAAILMPRQQTGS